MTTILSRPGGVKFLPGQWLDVYIPDPEIPKPGGFTITSEPRLARGLSQQLEEQKLSANQDQTSSPTGNPCLHVAVQNAPSNPAAAWLCQEPLQKILGKTLQVRVGGSFVWPPSHKKRPRAVIMIAGGVGIKYVQLSGMQRDELLIILTQSIHEHDITPFHSLYCRLLST